MASVAGDLPLTSADEWEKAYTDGIVDKIQTVRRRRKMSTSALAQACGTVLGRPVNESAVNALFAGRRKTIAVTEVLVYAAALKCAPIELLIPGGVYQKVELLPNLVVEPNAAVEAVMGLGGHSGLLKDRESLTTAFGGRDPGAANELLRSHQFNLEQILSGNRHIEVGLFGPSDIRHLRGHIHALRLVREKMAASGYSLPILPGGFEFIDDPAEEPTLPLQDLESVEYANPYLRPRSRKEP